MALKQDITIDQGTTFSQRFKIVNYDFSGDTWVAYSQIRLTAKASGLLGEFTTVFDGDIVTLSLEPEQTSAWTWAHGVYDVELHSNAGVVLRIVQGKIELSPEVTRDE